MYFAKIMFLKSMTVNSELLSKLITISLVFLFTGLATLLFWALKNRPGETDVSFFSIFLN